MTIDLICSKIDTIQFELEELKKIIQKNEQKNTTGKRLYGLLKGIEFREKDIEEAKIKIFKTEII
jgi:hypothetical protein